MKFTFIGYSKNESLARMCVAAFASQLDPTIEEIHDIKAAVSEAVTNCIVHAYRDTIGEITIFLKAVGTDTIYIKVTDKGCGIPNTQQALLPLYTTLPEGERAGLGFTVMQSFTDKLKVSSKVGKGTSVTMIKRLRKRESTDR